MAEQKRSVGKRILLVEDDPQTREAINLLLTIDRHEVVEAPGGAEAIELLKGRPFDLAILDYFMPGIQGSEVALRISRNDAEGALISKLGGGFMRSKSQLHGSWVRR
jgi:CheY-like chemotaxis protein